ncbi:hypothetical protein U1Q18_042165 [Sarracenia purpurea var. burkii]
MSGGGLTEFAVAKGNLTVPRPPEVSAAEGAALPIAALTAHVALTETAGIKLDGTSLRKNILITGHGGLRWLLRSRVVVIAMGRSGGADIGGGGGN